MKKLLSILLCLLMLLTLGACAGPKEESKEPENVEEEKGIVYFCLRLGDHSYNDNGWEAVQEVAKAKGVQADVVELGFETSTFNSTVLDICDSGKYSILVTQSNNGLAESCREAAKLYPDMKFICFDCSNDLVFDTDNIIGIAYREYEAAFMVGTVAAGATRTGKVGVVCFMDVPTGNDAITGFIDGVKTFNPDVTVAVSYANGFDAAVYLDQTNTMYDAGIDIVYGYGVSEAVHQAASTRGGAEAGFFTIGITSDEYTLYKNSNTPELADGILTSSEKDIKATILGVFDMIDKGTADWGKVMSMGVADGMIGYSDNEQYQKYVSEEAKARVAEIEKEIIDGKLKPKTFFDFADYDTYAQFRDAAAK